LISFLPPSFLSKQREYFSQTLIGNLKPVPAKEGRIRHPREKVSVIHNLKVFNKENPAKLFPKQKMNKIHRYAIRFNYA
jgi:hypothetical protein